MQLSSYQSIYGIPINSLSNETDAFLPDVMYLDSNKTNIIHSKNLHIQL